MHYVYVFQGEFQSILCNHHVEQNGDVWQGVLVQEIESLCPKMNSHKVNPKASAEFLLTFLLKSLECLPKVGAKENLIHFWRKLLTRNLTLLKV